MPLKNLTYRPKGYHAHDVKEFSERMNEIFNLSEQDTIELRQRARESVVERLSDKTFNREFQLI